MAVPGFSVSELLAALKKLRDVWDAFFDEFDNAPGRISELNDTILILDSALQFFAGLSQFQGVPPPLRLVHSYLHKLEECRKFIKKYESLTGRQSHGQNLIQIGRKSRDTIRYAFDGDAAILKNDLMLEAQKLNLIASLLQLGLLVQSEHRGTSATTTVHTTARTVVPPTPGELNASDARSFLESNPDLRGSFELAPSVANDRRASTSRRFLRGVRFGLPFQSHPNTRSSTITHSPEGDLSTKRAIAWSSTAVPPNHQTPLPYVPAQPRQNQLPRSGNDTSAVTTSNCSVVVVINSQPTPLQSYLIHRSSNSGPFLEWNGMDGNVRLLHYLGPDIFPLTIHSVQRESPYEVRFHYKHRILLWKYDKLEFDLISSVKYQFVAEEPLKVKTEFEQFQGHLRDQELVGGRFECDEIRSRSSSLAKNQHLKVWKTKTNPPIYSLSFYGKPHSMTQYPHLEFPIRWFEKPCYSSDSRRNGRIVQLRFVNQLDPFERSEPGRRRISWSRTGFTFSRSSSLVSSVTSTGTSSPRDYGFVNIESTMSSTTASTTSRLSVNHAEKYAPQDLIRSLDYLDVKFSSATDLENFKIVFNEAQTSMKDADTVEATN